MVGQIEPDGVITFFRLGNKKINTRKRRSCHGRKPDQAFFSGANLLAEFRPGAEFRSRSHGLKRLCRQQRALSRASDPGEPRLARGYL